MTSPGLPAPLQEIVQQAEMLPPFPNVVWKVMPLIQRMAPVHEIEAVIRYDPILTAKVLAFSQSAHYGRRQSIRSLREAIVCLGEQHLVQVVFTACSSRYFPRDAAGYDLREGELWEHAVAVALMSETLARHLGWEESLTAYTAALLHDIGKTVLNRYVLDYSEAILRLVHEKKVRFLVAEREVLGIDHQELGTLIARRWQLPKEVVTAIGFHHHPRGAGTYRDLIALVYAADRMVSALGIGCGVDGLCQPNEDEVFVDLGITPRMIDACLVDVVEALKEVKQLLLS